MTCLWIAIAVLWIFGSPALACVGRTLVVGTTDASESRVLAQVIAILINERTGTTVKIQDYADDEAVHRAIAKGEVDIAVERADRALQRLGVEPPADPGASFLRAKEAYLERLNLVWLPPFGGEKGGVLAAPVVRKDAIKKFPALPRLIAKTEGLLPNAVVAELARSGPPASSARQFLREKKLI